MATENLKKILNRIREKSLIGNEEALVVGWFDVITLLAFTALMFAFCGYIMDAVYNYTHTAYNTSPGFYNQSDVDTVDDIYNLYRFIPYVALGAVIFYIINYANVKRGDQ